MRKNKPLDQRRKTGQTSGTEMAFYSKKVKLRSHYRVCLSLSVVSAPLSLPARSMNEIFPTTFPLLVSLASFFLLVSFTSLCFFTTNCNMACDLEDSSLAPVEPVLLAAFPLSMYSLTICTSKTSNSCKPTMQTCCLPSSLMQSFLDKT
ncbi:hypothetical protein Hanom_Chr04g00316821 [Helianthus anomalus]